MMNSHFRAVRKINVNGSEKNICKYFDYGYCRFKSKCKFFHPSENCERGFCDIKSCPKRHPSCCKFFRRKKCKFDDECLFKHTLEVDKQIIDNENGLQKENEQLKNTNRALGEALEKMRKEIEHKNNIIKKQEENILTLANKISNLEADNSDLKDDINRCQVCDKMLKNKVDLKKHISDNHSNSCKDCENNKQLVINAECLRSRTQAIARDLMNEKKIHKDVCHFSAKCPHEMACISTCYYTDLSYIESDQESNDDDIDSDDNDLDDGNEETNTEQTYVSGSEVTKTKSENKCNQCNFEGKNQSGLKVHLKADHKIKCKICWFKTTTSVLLKKHVKQMHVFVN